jgi:hypothetical protein
MGLAIPVLLANHLSVTRAAWTLYGLDKGYIAELTIYDTPSAPTSEHSSRP